jgi:hypothetical protein
MYEVPAMPKKDGRAREMEHRREKRAMAEKIKAITHDGWPLRP